MHKPNIKSANIRKGSLFAGLALELRILDSVPTADPNSCGEKLKRKGALEHPPLGSCHIKRKKTTGIIV